jgi:hypothetical protein
MPIGSTTSANAASLALRLACAEIHTSATGTRPRNSPTPSPLPDIQPRMPFNGAEGSSGTSAATVSF